MTTPRFLIAKYAPDLKRMEPRNFGVIVWNEGTMATRWIEDRAHGLRRLNINDLHAYRQWIQFWNLQCGKESLRTRTGQVVPRTSEGFVDAIRGTGSGHYLLFDGGRMLDPVESIHTKDLADELFEELVTEEPDEEDVKEVAEAELLRRAAPKIIKRAGLLDRTGFRNGFDWICPVGDTLQPFHFDQGIYTDKPQAVIQKVLLRKHATIYNAAFMFDGMQSAGFLDKHNCAALVYATDEDLRDSQVYQSYKLLQGRSRVANAAEPESAEKILQSLAL